MDILIVVDMQNDFIDGALGTKEAVAIVKNCEDKIKNFKGEVIFTRDTHFENYMNTQEGDKLPVPHCIKGTYGHEICDTLKPYIKNEPIDKITFGSKELPEILCKIENISSITLIGLCTDICVISNAMILKAHFPEVKISVDSSCCAGVTPQSHENALNAMKMCQIEVI
jgi:nicotinamidase-related amidase